MQRYTRHPASTRTNKGARYTVGYGKPPQHSKFRPGRSGNPAGRPKGVRNLGTDVRHTLTAPVKVKQGGRSRTISTQEGLLMMLREKALQGDARSLDRLVELARRFNDEPAAVQQDLSADDQAILAGYAAEIIAEHTAESTSSTYRPRPMKNGNCAPKKEG